MNIFINMNSHLCMFVLFLQNILKISPVYRIQWLTFSMKRCMGLCSVQHTCMDSFLNLFERLNIGSLFAFLLMENTAMKPEHRSAICIHDHMSYLVFSQNQLRHLSMSHSYYSIHISIIPPIEYIEYNVYFSNSVIEAWIVTLYIASFVYWDSMKIYKITATLL